MADEEGQSTPPPADDANRSKADAGGQSAQDEGAPKEPLPFRKADDAFDVQVELTTERLRRVFQPGVDEVTAVHVGPRNNYYQLAGAVAPTPGPVRNEMLTSTARRYVPVSGYEDMEDALRERRLLLLGGASASGRSTTGLRLLNALAGEFVSRLDQASDLRLLGEDDFDKGHGYLGELTENAAGFTATTADRLADLLHRCDAYLVVIVPPEGTRGEVFTAYGADCAPPDTDLLLRRHLQAQLRPSDPDDLEDRLVKLADEPDIRAALGPSPQVREAVELAGLLVAYGRGALTTAEIKARCQRFVDQQVEEWFESLRCATRGDAVDRELRLTALRIAIAVLHETPTGEVLELAENLGDRFSRVLRPMREPSRRLVADHETTLLAATRACVVDGTIHYAGGPPAPTKDLRFRDDRFPQAVLSHAWRRHHNLRPPIANWLRKLAVDDRPWVRACAAYAAGVVSWVDFSWTFDRLVERAARKTPDDGEAASDSHWCQWEFAARALDHAAEDERLRPAVEAILRSWRRHGSRSQRCAAAIAWGLEIGRRLPDQALVELRIIGTPRELERPEQDDEEVDAEHGDQIWAAGRSIARLLATGAARQVLERLLRWTGPEQRRSVQLLALQTVFVLTNMRARDLSANAVARPGIRSDGPRFPGREKWPLLLAMLDNDPSLTSSVAEILRFALSGRSRYYYTDHLAMWLGRAQDDPACFATLARLLPWLANEIEERLRLQYVIERMGRSWANPIRPDVVERLIGELKTPRG